MADTATSTPGIKRLNPGIMSEQIAVRVRNVGDSKLRLEYANQRWEIEPDQDAVAPYLAACYWFGDPRAINVGNPANRSTQYRDREIERLSVLYGVYSEAFAVDEDGVSTIEQKVDDYRVLHARPYVNRRHPNLPRVEVFDLTTNEQILTVIDDPAGDNNAPHTNAPVEASALAAQIAAQQAQINEMARALATMDPDKAREVLAHSPDPANLDIINTEAIAAGLEDGATDIEEPEPTERASTDDGNTTRRRKPTTGTTSTA